MADRIVDGSRLEARVYHAVGALLVMADAVGIPIGAFHQFLEGLGIAFADEVAGPLPAKYRARWVSPRCAVIGLITGEEIEEKVGLAERPLLAAVSAFEDVAEDLLRRLPVEKVLLVGRALVGVARRHGDAVNAHFHHAIEELGHPLWIGIVEQSAIDIAAEASGFRFLDRGARALVGAFLADRP